MNEWIIPVLGATGTVMVALFAYRGVQEQARVAALGHDVAMMGKQGERIDALYLRIDKLEMEKDALQEEVRGLREMNRENERLIRRLEQARGLKR